MMINKVEICHKVKVPDNYPNGINNILGNIPGVINVRLGTKILFLDSMDMRTTHTFNTT